MTTEVSFSLANLLYHFKDSEQGQLLRQTENYNFFKFCLDHIKDSYSQNFQDLWVLYEHRYNLAFNNCIEFGAADGKTGSNTFLLEQYNWDCLLVEPNLNWKEDLFHNRGMRTQISNKCIYKESHLHFPFTAVTADQQLSTLNEYVDSDYNANIRRRYNNKEFIVETITLYDLLQEKKWFKDINYISVDTEGSELDILTKFFEQNKDSYKVNLFTIEHNYNEPGRDKIKQLMNSNGYERVFESFSRWDDFYRRIK